LILDLYIPRVFKAGPSFANATSQQVERDGGSTVNKGQGLTASAIVLTGVLLRPALTNNSQPGPLTAGSARTFSAIPSKQSNRDGPWKASCNYWKPGHWIDDREKNGSSDQKTPNLNMSVNEQGTKFQPHITGSLEEPDSGCGRDGWGIPAVNPNITALIATVPDPIHSSMAIEFDRSIDVLTQAAAESGYIGSYYWLPWKHHLDTLKSVQPGSDTEEKEDLDREKQPGLIILKKSDSIPELPPRSADDRLIYLFLVGQTPAVGVNGEQLQNALRAEVYLQKEYSAGLSFKHPDREADIIGPYSSGSAASLRAGLDRAGFESKIKSISVAGITFTDIASKALNSSAKSDPRKVEYLSFGDNTAFEQGKLTNLFSTSHPDASRIAFLSEFGTLYGQATATPCSPDPKKKRRCDAEPLVIRFPRGISLLRNAQNDENAPPPTGAEVNASPYLHLSLKDSGVEDTVPHFSPELTPFSQEAQWMAIVQELKRRHVEVVAITASNTLDELFLAKSLHRDLPDARLVFFGTSDLLFVRYADNAPYLGSVAFTPYPLTALSRSDSSQHLHDFANAWTEALYNATVYTLWDGKATSDLHLADYRNPFLPAESLHPSLWATTVGRDGYYPLGIVDQCASDNAKILPTIGSDGKPSVCKIAERPTPLERAFESDRPTFPSLSWYVLCLVIVLLCLAHSLVLHTAGFWSHLTRDLDIEHSDQPRRRAVYVHIATAMLISMSFITVYPILPTLPLLQFNATTSLFAAVTILSAILAASLTLRRTWRHTFKAADDTPQEISPCRRPLAPEEKDNLASEATLYPLFNLTALITTLAVAVVWVYLCEKNTGPAGTSFVGLFFSYRCLHPASGVSPLLPILLLLFTWYLWALLQTKRLRFSENSRPMLPKSIPFPSYPAPPYISDDALGSCSRPLDPCLYQNITCLLITRQIIRRFLPKRGSRINGGLALVYCVLFVVFVFGLPVQSLDRFLRNPDFHLTPYEFLISALFYPLLVVAMTGAVRMLYIWSSLSQGLLEPLERSPLRFAFSRLTNVAWMSMLRQGGLLEYWRDMTRSNEAIQQILHISEITGPMLTRAPILLQKADVAKKGLQQHIEKLLQLVQATAPMRRPHGDRPQPWDESGNYLRGKDLPLPSDRGELNLMCAIECDYATFAEALLAGVLVPYWSEKRCSPVEAELSPSASGGKEKHEAESPETPGSKACGDPPHIRLAEEFLAIRYLSLIRSVLINLRQLMTFVSIAFVLALVAWNSYPFEPRQWINWAFTGLLFMLGTGVVYVFAQMHRNPILSRITGTQANELGIDFYIRLVAFGAVPVLTWLASQFPTIGSSVSRLLQSGSGFAK
jgi:hypothetical protein